MKLKQLAIILSAIFCVPAFAAGTMTLKNQQDKASYAIGANLGQSLKARGVSVKEDILIKGFRDAYAGKKLLLSDKQMQKAFVVLSKKMMKKQQAKLDNLSERNAKNGASYLTENARKPGVKTTKTGLQYKVLNAGKGTDTPALSDSVTVDYEGTLIGGKVFDSSYKRGQSASFALSDVIPGWQEALQLMPKGATWTVYVPAKLAYGTRGVGGFIGPNETLIFKIHLIDFKPKSQLTETKKSKS